MRGRVNKMNVGDIGNIVFRVLNVVYDLPPEVGTALQSGNSGEALELLRGNPFERRPTTDIIRGLRRSFPGVNPHTVIEAVENGEYDAVSSEIMQNYNPFAQDSRLVAEILCGSEMHNSETGARAVISRISAWETVGGGNQSMTLATPGTANYWHSNARGGYDIGVIAAHAEGQQGIVALWGIKPLEDDHLKAEVTSKTAIASDYGFTTVMSGGNILDEKTPLEITLRNPSLEMEFGGSKYHVVNVGESRELGDGKLLAVYRLQRAK